ncbi:protein FAM204A isoform X2 [Labrus mixtus]|uniref:protein FAM204A isoform X2 n=1 Tax=Labrus mixtus TaxID=508554 RepID=UPI0029C02064|nr:protein FAM204A isoform X2 [Labrus mixtus]
MYNGLLPKGLTEEDLSSDDEQDDTKDNVEEKKEEEEEEEEEEEGDSSAKKLGSAGENKDSGAAADLDSMPGISQEMWQKFQHLQKKNAEMKAMPLIRRRKRRRPKKAGTKSEEPTDTSKLQEEREKHWDELKQYFGVNDRFHPPPCSEPPPKSGLEKSTERAIAEGDTAKAEEMSDRLATRELAVKIAQAADCRDFVRRKQEEEALRAAQKRKNEIAWGFEAKKRWETKSNMGFM